MNYYINKYVIPRTITYIYIYIYIYVVFKTTYNISYLPMLDGPVGLIESVGPFTIILLLQIDVRSPLVHTPKRINAPVKYISLILALFAIS